MDRSARVRIGPGALEWRGGYTWSRNFEIGAYNSTGYAIAGATVQVLHENGQSVIYNLSGGVSPSTYGTLRISGHQTVPNVTMESWSLSGLIQIVPAPPVDLCPT